MQSIKENPYRKVGLLIGASAREQDRQIRRLKQFIEAEQLPEDDFSFPTLGPFNRTIDDITEAASKLNLDYDKLSAALFWFYKGNPITDEPAFDLLKEGNLKEAVQIWGKLSQNKEITKKNASAYFNRGNLYLNVAFKGITIDETYLEKGLSLKLTFLESEFVKELQELATDSTFQISKKEIQLLFLKKLQEEIDRNGTLSSSNLIEIINRQEFTAKADFLKDFVQGPIAEIEHQIAETKAKRKAYVRDAEIYGNELNENTEELLEQLLNILGDDDIKYQNIADKLALEILQCGIDFFKEFKEDDYDPCDESMKLFEIAESIAVGSIATQRCQENIENLQDWIDDKPQRDKHRQIKEDLEYVYEQLEDFQDWEDSVENAEEFLDSCKPRLQRIKSVLGAYDELYLGISSAVMQNAQGMLVSVVNDEVEKASKQAAIRFGLAFYDLEDTITKALDVTYKLGGFDMIAETSTHYKKNLLGIRSIALKLGISILHPKQRLEQQISSAESSLRSIQSGVYLKSELDAANAAMSKIKEWHFMRSDAEREQQIRDQQRKIDQIKARAEQEKATEIRRQQSVINELKNKLSKIDY